MSSSVVSTHYASGSKSRSRYSRGTTNFSDRAGEEIEFANQKALKDTWVSRMRIFLAPYFAEFFGTAVFVIM
ncbi:hypothetical protein IWW55_003939, partial [Coemansia sp. RSA 2706]